MDVSHKIAESDDNIHESDVFHRKADIDVFPMSVGEHFYRTPQAEMNYGRIDGTSYTMRADSTAGADAIREKWKANLGARIGF